MKNYHGQREIITAGDYVMHVTDSGKICRAYVQRTDGDLLELQFSDEDYGCELKSSCWKDEKHFWEVFSTVRDARKFAKRVSK